ncbi:hypothetical protein [Paenibacillus mucilaginosus]|uniref:hypothetical protein n=1 Tax=Paenibacillus mucilaginosus TaxID=61624 RepID=UPI003D221840
MALWKRIPPNEVPFSRLEVSRLPMTGAAPPGPLSELRLIPIGWSGSAFLVSPPGPNHLG